MADLMAEIEERMEPRRERSRQRRVAFRRMVDLESRYPGFGRLPARLMAPAVRMSFRLRPPEETPDA